MPSVISFVGLTTLLLFPRWSLIAQGLFSKLYSLLSNSSIVISHAKREQSVLVFSFGSKIKGQKQQDGGRDGGPTVYYT